MMSKMLGMFSNMLPPSQPPANPVAQFLSDVVEELYPDNEIVGMIQTSLIDVANNDPNAVMRALVRIHGDIGEFVGRLQCEDEVERDGLAQE